MLPEALLNFLVRTSDRCKFNEYHGGNLWQATLGWSMPTSEGQTDNKDANKFGINEMIQVRVYRTTSGLGAGLILSLCLM